jgi:RNA polymerase sigma-70 factor, ECF subfamily
MPDPKRYDEFAGLVRLHAGQMLAYVNALLLNWNDAEDVFQETCLVCWQKFDEFRPGTKFLAWALRVADYKVMAFQRKQSRVAAFNARLRDAMMADVADRSAEEAAAGLTALSSCMDRLAEGDRRMVALCYGERVPVRQIADALGRSPQSVHHSLCRIRKWLLGCVRRELRQAEAPPSIHRDIDEEEDRP